MPEIDTILSFSGANKDRLIRENPEWEYAGVYADDCISTGKRIGYPSRFSLRIIFFTESMV